MNTDELREELQRLGRQPVPAPRRDFVEGLLTRIQLAEDLAVPAPIQLVPRQPWAKFRMVAAGAVAAALLAAVGLFSLFQAGSPSRGGELAHATSVGAATQPGTLKVTADGRVTLADNPDASVKDGTYSAECKQDARIQTRDSGSITCSKGEQINLTVESGQILVAQTSGTTGSSTELAVPTTVPTTSTPATSAAPGTGPTSTSPTSAPANPPATAAVTPASTTSTTAGTRPPASGDLTPMGPGGVQSNGGTLSSSFALQQAQDTGDGSVTITWPPYAANADARYLVLRTISKDAKVDPQTPWYGETDPSSPVVATLEHGSTSYTAAFDGSDVPVDTPKVSYRVVVVDAQGKPLAVSSTLTLELRWQQLKPADDGATTTTATPPPTSTPTSVPADPSEGGQDTTSTTSSPAAG